MTHQERISAANGCELIADTTERTGKSYYALIAQEDTVILTLSGVNDKGDSVNFISTIGLSGKTLKQGALITVPLGNKITNLDLTSGSVIAYNL